MEMTYTPRIKESVKDITPVSSELTYGCPKIGLADRVAGLSRDFFNLWKAPESTKWSLKQIEDTN